MPLYLFLGLFIPFVLISAVFYLFLKFVLLRKTLGIFLAMFYYPYVRILATSKGDLDTWIAWL